MYGIEAINAHNGWAMALAGALIVMSGLAVLSFIISKLHTILEFMQRKTQGDPAESGSVPAASKTAAPVADHDLSNLEPSVSCYCAESAKLGQTFNLQDLFSVFNACDYPHPHLTIRSLKEQGYLVPAGEDRYSWKK